VCRNEGRAGFRTAYSRCSTSHVYNPPLAAPALADTGKFMRILLLWGPGILGATTRV